MVCWKSWSDKHLLRLFAPGRKLSRPSCCRCSDTLLRQGPGSGWCWGGWPRGPHCLCSGRCGGGCLVRQARRPESKLPGVPACPSPCTTATQTHWCCRPFHWMKPKSWGCHLRSGRRYTWQGTFYYCTIIMSKQINRNASIQNSKLISFHYVNVCCNKSTIQLCSRLTQSLPLASQHNY